MISCDNQIYTAPMVQRSEEKMNDFTVNPVAEYPAYYQGPGGVIFGIPTDISHPSEMVPVNAELIVGEETQPRKFDQFFLIDSVLYFKLSLKFYPENPEDDIETVVKFCRQTDGNLKYLDEADFPLMPEMERLVYDDGTLTVSIEEFEGEQISILERDYREPMEFVDAVFRIEGAYLVSAPHGRGPSRPDGVLLWPDGKRWMTKWKDPGMMWVK
jgi:hypothetical protein